MKKKDLKYFVRFGGCSIKTQKGFTNKNKTYHSPPSSRGFYAMPFIAQEHFLISSMRNYQPGTTPKLKKNSNDWTSEQWEDFNKREKKSRSLMRKEFFKDKGNIWHHLTEYTPHSKVLESNGSWIKTDIKDWVLAFNKMSVTLRAQTIKEFRDFSKDNFNLGLNTIRSITGFYSKDHCEVFFDEKV